MDNMIKYFKKPIITDNRPKIAISCCSNVYVRQMIFEKKDCVEFGHSHEFDHTSFVATGSVEVQVYDEEKDEMLPPVTYNAPSMIFIKKNLVHQIKSLEENTSVYCIHALRDINDNIISPTSIPVPDKLENVITRLYQDSNINLKSPVIDDKFTKISVAQDQESFEKIGEN